LPSHRRDRNSLLRRRRHQGRQPGAYLDTHDNADGDVHALSKRSLPYVNANGEGLDKDTNAGSHRYTGAADGTADFATTASSATAERRHGTQGSASRHRRWLRRCRLDRHSAVGAGRGRRALAIAWRALPPPGQESVGIAGWGDSDGVAPPAVAAGNGRKELDPEVIRAGKRLEEGDSTGKRMTRQIQNNNKGGAKP